MCSYFGWKSLGSVISLSDFKEFVLNSSVESLQGSILFSKIIFVGELLSRISILRYSVTFELKIHFNKIKFFSVFFSTNDTAFWASQKNTFENSKFEPMEPPWPTAVDRYFVKNLEKLQNLMLVKDCIPKSNLYKLNRKHMNRKHMKALTYIHLTDKNFRNLRSIYVISTHNFKM